MENFVLAVFVKVVQKENQLFERINGVEEKGESLEQTEIKNELHKLFQDFYWCSHFIILLSLFEEDGKLQPEWDEKQKYCKCKAALGEQFL